MKVIPGPDGWPEGYEYTAGGQSIRFMDEAVPGVRPILHTKMFHPANDHYGMSPIEAASVAIDIHNEASKWNKALLDNSARPSGALVYAASNGQMTGEQFQRLKDELETSYQGARHAGRPLLLEGGLDWKPLSLSPKDMDFIEAKNLAAREIALAMGVPPQLLGIPGDSTYSNYAEAQRAFWRGTVLPLVNRMSRAFGSWLSPAYGSVLEVRPDLDSVEALNPEREALWARLDAASFLTEDEKRVAAGYGVKGESEASLKYSPDQPRVPAGDPDGGQWTDGGGGGEVGSAFNDGRVQVAQATGSRGGGRVRVSPTAPVETQLLFYRPLAAERLEQVRTLDPAWRAPQSVTNRNASPEAELAHLQATILAAEARLAELGRLVANPLPGRARHRRKPRACYRTRKWHRRHRCASARTAGFQSRQSNGSCRRAL